MKESQAYLSLFEDYLKQRSFEGDPISVYEPIQYIMQMGGKRFRPVLTLLAGDIFGDLSPLHFELALGIEVFHNFTLLHDDIMDQADIRRGHEAVHKRFGTNAAILSGDLMLILATQIMHSATRRMEGIDDVMELFLEVGKEVCEGQERDMTFETASGVKMDEYVEMVRQKTAVLLGFSLYAGARASGISRDKAMEIYSYGVQSGIVFQIWDDYLDVFASDTSGKRSAGDIYNKKETCLIIRLREEMNPSDSRIFREIWSRNALNDADVLKVCDLLKKYDIDAHTTLLAKKKLQKARDIISTVFGADQLNPLFTFTEQFIQRNK